MGIFHMIHKITHPSEGPSAALAKLGGTNIFFGRQLFVMLRTQVSALFRPSCRNDHKRIWDHGCPVLQAELPFLPPYRPEVVFLHVLGLSTVPRFDFLAVIIDLSRARLVTSVVTRLVYAAQRVLIRKMADKTSC